METMMTHNHKNKSQQGFTLVELSIVLVIIGLIIASVLVGQDLVKSAELRATITQYEGFNTAVATFKGKYNGLPGDVRGAADFGFVGNGDGSGTFAASTALTGENVFFWSHLGSTGASLISGSYVGTTAGPVTADIATFLPAAKVGGYWGVYTPASGINYYILGVAGGAQGIYLTANVLTPLNALSIDTKVDDGKPGRGLVQARGANATDADTAPVAGAGSPNCVTVADATGAYVTQTATNVCTLRLRQQI